MYHNSIIRDSHPIFIQKALKPYDSEENRHIAILIYNQPSDNMKLVNKIGFKLASNIRDSNRLFYQILFCINF